MVGVVGVVGVVVVVMTLILSVRSGTLVHTCTSTKDYMAGQVREQMREKREKQK